MTRFCTTINERHSEKDATCIEYSLANFMLPTVLLGSITGVWFNEAMPEVVTQACLVVLLTVMGTKTAFKARETVLKENAKFEAEEAKE